MTPAAWGLPTASEWGAESEVAHNWAAAWGGPHRFRAGGRIRSDQNQKWPTSGQGGYITPAA